MRRRFATLDVFTSRRFAGNPLAVVLDAAGLDGGAMQSIAGEFNLAETVFVSAAQQPSHRAQLRIFTPARELPFAGHPTIGTAVLLNRVDGGATREIVLEEGIGPIHCSVQVVDADRGRARFRLARLPQEAGDAADRETIATALGLDATDIGFGDFAPARWSAGVPFTFVPVRGLDAIRRCRVSPPHWDRAFGQDSPTAAYIFCRETVERGSTFHARMFGPGLGIREDPATGSAAAAFAAVLVQSGQLSDGDHDIAIEQGYEMGRPSIIGLSVTVRNRQLAAAAISGDAVVVSEGTIEA